MTKKKKKGFFLFILLRYIVLMYTINELIDTLYYMMVKDI